MVHGLDLIRKATPYSLAVGIFALSTTQPASSEMIKPPTSETIGKIL